MNKRPIGIFDSGIGGLTVFSEIRKRFPQEDLIYFGDTARVPYGPKSKSTVIDYSIQNTRFLNSFQVKLVVIACNTSSAVAIEHLRKTFSVPIVGVLEPGAEQAVKVSKTGRIGIIGTEGTINSMAYPRAIESLNPEAKACSNPCPLFVSLVEEGWQDHPVALTIAREYLYPLIDEGIDTLVLGCTHYPILKPVIQEAVGKGITLIDSAEAISRHLSSYLEEPALEQTKEISGSEGKDYFYVSDNEEKFRKIASRILNQEIINLVQVKLAESWFI